MSVQLDHVVDLNNQEVIDWLAGGGSQPFKEEIDDSALRKEGLEIVNGSDRAIAPSENQKIEHITASVRYYELIKIAAATGKERKLKDLSVQVPVSHELSIGIESVLYIANSGLSANGRKIIEDAYAQFNGQDPILFIAEKLNSPEAKQEGLTTNHFHIALRYTLEQIGSPTPNLDQVDALEKFYRGGASIDGDREWFGKERIELRYKGEKSGHKFENPKKDPLREQDANGRSDSSILDEVAEKVAGDLNCDDHYTHKSHPVMTVLAWPEFKIEWYAHYIKIGCTRIKIWLPKLRTRTAEIVLYATVAIAKRDADQTLVQIAGDCAVSSALVGGVVGVVMWNFAAALAAFKVLFEKCIYIKIGQHLTCMVPELVLITKKGTWS